MPKTFENNNHVKDVDDDGGVRIVHVVLSILRTSISKRYPANLKCDCCLVMGPAKTKLIKFVRIGISYKRDSNERSFLTAIPIGMDVLTMKDILKDEWTKAEQESNDANSSTKHIPHVNGWKRVDAAVPFTYKDLENETDGDDYDYDPCTV